MPLNYRKNNVNYTIEYYSDINDLNYSGLNASKVNVRVNNVTNYIGLVSSAHEQASDLSVRVDNTNLRLAKKSFAPPTGLSYNSGQTAIPLISSSVSYSPTLTTGTKITYSVSPSLPSGLSLNTSTGVISGTTPSSSNDNTYTITATNSSGSNTYSFRIRVVLLNTTMTVGANYVDLYDSEYGDYATSMGYGQPNRGGVGSIPSKNFSGTTIEALAGEEWRNGSYQIVETRISFILSGNQPNSNSIFSKITIGNNTIFRGATDMQYMYAANQNATMYIWYSGYSFPTPANTYSWFRPLIGTTVPLIIE